MNGIEAKKETVALKPIVLDTLNLLQQNLSSKNIKIDLALTEPFNIYADANHVQLVLRNLISNAIKYSYPNGRIVLSAKQEQAFVYCSVQDFGTGMSKAKLDSLFVQGEITSQYGTQNEKGTGLGLMLCKEFVEKNGGRVWGESEDKKGSTFTFSMPVA
jgi:signal transduction histidine kinase